MIIFKEADVDASAEYVTKGETQVLASGTFGTSRIAVHMQQEGLRPAYVTGLTAPGSTIFRTAPNTTMVFTIIGGAKCSIDLTANTIGEPHAPTE